MLLKKNLHVFGSVAVTAVLATLLSTRVSAFTVQPSTLIVRNQNVAPLFLSSLTSESPSEEFDRASETSTTKTMTRSFFLSSTAATLLATTSAPVVAAEEENDPTAATTTTSDVVVAKEASSVTITPCPDTGMSNANSCVSTSNPNRVAAYSPPWTFACDPDRAYKTLLTLLNDDELSNFGRIKIVSADPVRRYVKATAVRLRFTDELEFLVRPEEKVVVFRSGEKDNGGGNSNDFGANKQRLEKMRKKSRGVFGVMGDLGGDDYYGGASNGGGNGIIGQLKAFYGLQSGEGYQDVFD